MAKAAGKKGSEQDKDLLALVELQDKLNMNAGLVQMVRCHATVKATVWLVAEGGLRAC